VQAEVAKGEGVYIGRRMNTTANKRLGGEQCQHGEGGCCVFNAGGPGYLFDNVALTLLAGSVLGCRKGQMTGVDDLFVGCCLEAVGVHALDTRDEAGGDRFHVFDPQFCEDYTLPKDRAKAMREDWWVARALARSPVTSPRPAPPRPAPPRRAASRCAAALCRRAVPPCPPSRAL
jgi:hypothetical protein